jgi:hypothetical protein
LSVWLGVTSKFVGLAAHAVRVGTDRFEVEFVDHAGIRRSGELRACWPERFERVRPVREFSFRRGQRSFAGWWWAVTTDELVGYESWLERDHAMMLDFDPEVTGFASQPFWLSWQDNAGRRRRHAPDYFVRRRDGSGLVADVRADDRIGPSDEQAFAATQAACAQAGWSFARLGEPEPVLAANVRWLSRYRHPRCGGSGEQAGRLAEAFAGPRPLFAGAERAGDRLEVLPVLFHLMWRRVLLADLRAEPLHAATMVTRAGRG